MGLICIILMTNDGEYVFMCLLAIPVSLVKCVLKSFTCFLLDCLNVFIFFNCAFERAKIFNVDEITLPFFFHLWVLHSKESLPNLTKFTKSVPGVSP